MTMVDIYISGGVIWMHPITLMFLINIVIVVLELIGKIRNPAYNFPRISWIKQVGGLALAWGVFSTVIALFQAFGDLSKSGDTIPFYVIMGGLQVALITAIYGLIVFMLSFLMAMVLALVAKKTIS
jgi:hypothetical protein